MFRSGDIEDFATNFGHESYNLDFSNHRFFFLPFFISSLKMAITILPPVVDDADVPQADSDIDAMSMDSESDADTATGGHFQSAKRHHIAGISKLNTGIVTPGEVVTDDPQWMRLAALSSLIYYLWPGCFQGTVSRYAVEIFFHAPKHMLTKFKGSWNLYQSAFYVHHRHCRWYYSENQQTPLCATSSRALYAGDR